MTARNRLIQTTADNIIDALRMGCIGKHVQWYVIREYIDMATEDNATFASLWRIYDTEERDRVMFAIRRRVNLNKNK